MTQRRLCILASVLALPACILPGTDDTEETADDSATSSASASASNSDPGSDDGPDPSADDSTGSDGEDVSSSPVSDSSSGDESSDTGEGLPSAVAIAIAVGRLHACAVTDAFEVRCWGYNDYGQVGNGDAPDDNAYRIPVTVTGLADARAISSFGDHTCALDGSGTAWCWGANDYGQLGDGSMTQSSSPVAVAGGPYVAIDVGYAHSCGITEALGVQCWGHNDYGQLGDETIDDRSTPVDVAGLADVTSVTAGRDHSCAVAGGSLFCWGGDTYGELGNGEPLSASPTPVEITIAAGAVSVQAGDNDTCAIADGGAAWCWGKNADGQLGNGESGTLAESNSPTAVVGLESGTEVIEPGFGYTCAVVSDATMCWGDNFDLVIGNGEEPGYETPVPVDVTGLGSGSATVKTCSGHACALDDAGAVRCWGTNDGGGLGDGSEESSNVPVAVVSLP